MEADCRSGSKHRERTREERKTGKRKPSIQEKFTTSTLLEASLRQTLPSSLLFTLTTMLRQVTPLGPSKAFCLPCFWPLSNPADQWVFTQTQASGSRKPKLELDCFSLIKFMVYTNSITSFSVWMVAREARSLTHIHHQGAENQGHEITSRPEPRGWQDRVEGMAPRQQNAWI